MKVERAHVDRQRRFYESREHAHLRPQPDDHYARKLVARLAAAVGVRPHHRVVEIGASFGRFTLPMLAHCASVLAVDISEHALAALVAARDAAGVDPARCRVLVGDARHLTRSDIGGDVDLVVGFFVLHHLEDVPGTIGSISRLVAPGGGVGFLEPNRRNPLFLAQVLACRDMAWREEKGMFSLSAGAVCRAYADAGLDADAVRRFGFFPPQLVNRFAWARRIEAAIERSHVLDPLLPFLILSARRPERSGEVAEAETNGAT